MGGVCVADIYGAETTAKTRQGGASDFYRVSAGAGREIDDSDRPWLPIRPATGEWARRRRKSRFPSNPLEWSTPARIALSATRAKLMEKLRWLVPAYDSW